MSDGCDVPVKPVATGGQCPGRGAAGVGPRATPHLHAIGNWKAYRLTGDRKGIWSLTVTRNWRLTFLIDPAEGEIINLDFEDYH